MRNSVILAVLFSSALPIIIGCSGKSPGLLSGNTGDNGIVIDGSLTLDIFLPNGEPVPDTLVVSLARPPTVFNFSLPTALEYFFRIIDETGSAVFTISGKGMAGGNSVIIDFSGQSSGIYMLNIRAGQFYASRVIALIKL
ncbi:MAG: hypothetical protein IH914_10540 [candidate division Zixibacteria bacterium]|nr:hypothetical protein [candidate division Zixibacteria bacterium]